MSTPYLAVSRESVAFDFPTKNRRMLALSSEDGWGLTITAALANNGFAEGRASPRDRAFLAPIRKQPASLSAAELVAKGKAAGIKFSTQLVYNVRGGAKPKKVLVKKTSTAKPTTPTKPTQSKAEFVRGRSHLSPKEIVEDAKAAGMKLDVGYVYNVRGAAKARSKTKGTKLAARRSTERKAPPVPRPITTTSSAETLLKALGAEIGLARAVEILQGERARVRAVIGVG